MLVSFYGAITEILLVFVFKIRYHNNIDRQCLYKIVCEIIRVLLILELLFYAQNIKCFEPYWIVIMYLFIQEM